MLNNYNGWPEQKAEADWFEWTNINTFICPICIKQMCLEMQNVWYSNLPPFGLTHSYEDRTRCIYAKPSVVKWITRSFTITHRHTHTHTNTRLRFGLISSPLHRCVCGDSSHQQVVTVVVREEDIPGLLWAGPGDYREEGCVMRGEWERERERERARDSIIVISLRLDGQRPSKRNRRRRWLRIKGII